MRSFFSNLLIVFFIVFELVACQVTDAANHPGGEETYATGEEEKRVVHIWVQDTPLIPLHVMQDAFDAWQATGLTVVQVETYDEGDGRIALSDGHVDECALDEKGGYILAMSYPKKQTTFIRPKCIQNGAESYGGEYEGLLRLALIHEIGHLVGIWGHVPTHCGGPEEEGFIHDENEEACGPAIMNPGANPMFRVRDTVTLPDLAAFDLREKNKSIIGARAAEGEGMAFTL